MLSAKRDVGVSFGYLRHNSHKSMADEKLHNHKCIKKAGKKNVFKFESLLHG